MTRRAMCLIWISVACVACGDSDSDTNGANGDGGASTDASAPGTDAGSQSAAVARGDYLVNHVSVCVDCHTPRNEMGEPDMSKYLSGVECFVDVDPTDPDVGCIHSANLTNHETGLANRSDQEIKDMFQKGMRPNGDVLHPTMPYWVFGNMTDEDADAIVAFLRTVDGVDHMVPKNQPPFTAPDAPAPTIPDAVIPMPVDDKDPNYDSALRGRYLTSKVGVCIECHTPEDDMMQPDLSKAFQGGRVFESALLGLPPVFPAEIYTANVTPSENGLKDWTVEDIVKVLKEGIDDEGVGICPPMPVGPDGAFGGLTDDDATDIAHYLLSIPPGGDKVPMDCMPPMGPPSSDDAGTSM